MPGGILTVILRSCVTRPAPWQDVHGLLMTLAGALTLRARARDGEESLLKADLSHAAALRADGRRRDPGAAPDPLHVSQASCRGIWIDVSTPLADSSNADLEVVAQIGAALRTAAPAVPGAEDVAEAEHAAEDVGEVAELVEDRRIETRHRRGGADALWPKRS